MSRVEISDKIEKAEWEKFLLDSSHPPFLQSWNMRALHESVSEQPFTFAIRKEGKLIGVAFAAFVQARRGNYLFLPYGPVFKADGWKYLPELTAFLANRGRELGADFIRSSPFVMSSIDNLQVYSAAGWRSAPIHMLAEKIWWLDIRDDEDIILKGMRKTMRNLIKRAGRDGVVVTKSKSSEDIEEFIKVHDETVERHGFTPYTNDYFHSQVRSFADDDQVLVFLAKYRGKTIAASIIMYYGDTASYHHGASLSSYRKIPASYLMQWEAIQEAKERGCVRYNFWGIVPEDQYESPILKRKHPWIGISKFKMGFGGSQFDLLHCQDYPLTSKYCFTWLVETGRRIKRGY